MFKDSYSQEIAVLLSPHPQQGEFNAGEAVTKAQEVVKSMLATGFVLGKDASLTIPTVYQLQQWLEYLN
ncbi:unnamed protein product [Eruca vesicaria subsp. sativa]|uniref:Uncharacterized protein n=1 Tax=Eruca vesicaria subsp. sativa TaxID=29727 RepID=A0ABC8LVN8_ERUVS|nr:unnamed protein product [Eruca vesicaria subsp. sativa]